MPEVPDISIEPTTDGFAYWVELPFISLKRDTPMRRKYRIILPFAITFQTSLVDGSYSDHIAFIGTPVSTRETKFFKLIGRKHRLELSDDELRERSDLVVEQDREIVESQRPEELPLDLSEELHLRGPDAAAVEYRRRLRQLGINWS